MIFFVYFLTLSSDTHMCVVYSRFLSVSELYFDKMRCPLTYKVISECSTTKARVGVMSLVHSDVNTPVSLISYFFQTVAVLLDHHDFERFFMFQWCFRYLCLLALKVH